MNSSNKYPVRIPIALYCDINSHCSQGLADIVLGLAWWQMKEALERGIFIGLAHIFKGLVIYNLQAQLDRN